VDALADVDELLVARHITVLRKRFGRASSTVNTRISALRSFFRWAQAERRPPLVRRDPTVGLKMRKVLPPARPPLTLAELRALLRAAETPQQRALLLTMLDTGVRRSEALAIRGRDVDWRTGTIVIRDGKGGRPRLVAVGVVALAALGELRNGDDHLWRLSKSSLKRLLDGMAGRAGLPPGAVYPHRLRVTRICDLIGAGADQIGVAAVDGHSLEMVRYYQRSIEELRAVEQQRRLSLADRL